MYEIDRDTIRFANGKRQRFSSPIAESLDFDASIVIRLESGPKYTAINVFAFDYYGKLLWHIPAPRSYDPQNPYVGIFRKGGFVEILNWDGHLLTLHAEKGMILKEGFFAEGRPSSRRTPSVRRWL
jgi:hypothetical protein